MGVTIWNRRRRQDRHDKDGEKMTKKMSTKKQKPKPEYSQKEIIEISIVSALASVATTILFRLAVGLL